MKRIALFMAAAVIGPVLMSLGIGSATPAGAVTSCGNASDPVVYVLDTTVSGGCSSNEVSELTAINLQGVILDASEWGALTAADFNAARGILLGDPTCGYAGGGNTAPFIAAAEANRGVWSPTITGNVIVTGTDPVYHQTQGGLGYTQKAVDFAFADPAKRGAFIGLSCYYDGVAPGTSPAVLDQLGSFTTGPASNCYNNIHIVATHPALNGLTDANLENWGCSVHETFDTWPLDFEVLVIAEDLGSAFTAPDGTVGTPYILARGVQVISDIKLSPEDATNQVGDPHTLRAIVTADGAPVAGTVVTFTVVGGPCAGVTGSDATDSSGTATFTYTCGTTGTDTIEATFVDARGRTQRSNRVTKTWIDTPPPPPKDPCSDPGLLTKPTLAQKLWNGLLNGNPLVQDPDADGPISEPVDNLQPSVPAPLRPAVHDAACAINLPFLDL